MANFAIGATNPPDNLEILPVPLPVPRAYHQNTTERITAASGRVYARGYPSCRWVFSILTSEQVGQLRAFCSGESAEVYITTLANDDQYHTYKAVMIWPEETDRQPAVRDRLEFELMFSHLVEVP